MAQNSALIISSTAIRPIFGSGKKRSDGEVNNAGADSWAGHSGHCQNVMSHHRTKMGIGFRQDRADSSKMFYWTQDFN